jgi:hypothetical protein
MPSQFVIVFAPLAFLRSGAFMPASKLVNDVEICRYHAVLPLPIIFAALYFTDKSGILLQLLQLGVASQPLHHQQ